MALKQLVAKFQKSLFYIKLNLYFHNLKSNILGHFLEQMCNLSASEVLGISHNVFALTFDTGGLGGCNFGKIIYSLVHHFAKISAS